jgi:para-nitrobenzyl esterase
VLSASSAQVAAGAVNWGLQDQQAGLRWIQDNARALGGDPGRVMIFGQSVSGFPAHIHRARGSP